MAGVHGILLLDKPLGLSSNQALQRAKRALGADKAGHTGSLDPLASGMLPLVFGEATKVAGHLLGARKAYRAEVRLGVTTSTDDAEGEVLAERAVPEVDAAARAGLLARFTGRIRQRPPVFAAIKQGGVPLYRRARRGETVVVPEREVSIEALEQLDWAGDRWTLQVVCGSGTYIRSLARDLGEALGCGAHLAALRRLWVEPFEGAPMIALDAVAAEALLPIEAGLVGWPRVDLDAVESSRLRHGHGVQRPGLDWTGNCRLHDADGRLAALGVRSADGEIRPKRVLRSDA